MKTRRRLSRLLVLTLTLSTSYYLVLRGVSLNYFLGWAATDSTAGTGFPSSHTTSNDGGTSWDAPDATSYTRMMQIQADQVSVPVPATLPLAALGLAALGLTRRRRAPA